MEDPQPPSVQPKKKLLFKRTIHRKSAEKPKDDDDGLALFSRSNEFFPTVVEDRQREAAEKAAKAEKERKENLQRAQREGEESLCHKEEHEEEDETPSAKKRRRLTLSDEDEDDDVFTTKPHKSRKAPTATPKSPSVKRNSLGRDSSIAKTPRSTRSSRNSRAGDVRSAVITLDSSDGEETKDVKPAKSLSPLGRKPSPAERHVSTTEESDLELDTDPQAGQDGDTDFDCYIRGALERAEKRKQERLEREAAVGGGGGSGGGGGDGRSDPAVQILISSAVDGIQPIVFKRKLFQSLAVVQRTWVEQQVAKGAPVPRDVLQDMFFTWRGAKVYPNATLETLGIRPPSSADGSLYPRSSSSRASASASASNSNSNSLPPEGYYGRDKVHFEAWTQPLYEEYLRQRERERQRARGELPSDDEEGEAGREAGRAEDGGGDRGEPGQQQQQQQEEEKTIKIILKARDMAPENIKVRPSTVVAMLAVVFKRLKKLPADKTVELHWDGDVLDPDQTVGEAEIEDMDSIEVHIK